MRSNVRPNPGSFLPLSPTDFQVLLALARQPLHGYAIMKVVEESSDGRLSIEIGSLYRIIARLSSAGLIEESREPDAEPRPGRKRRVYGLTPLGRAVAQAEAHRLRDTVALARAEKLITDTEGL